MADNTTPLQGIDTSAIVDKLRAMDGTALDQGGGFFGETADLIEALSCDLEAMRAKCDAALVRVAELEAACASLIVKVQVLAKCAGGVDQFMENARLVAALNDAATAISFARTTLSKETGE